MRTLYISILFLLASLTAFPQEYNSDVENTINEVSMDSLIYYLRNLSGEDPVVVDGDSVFIDHRVNNWGNELAGDYLMEAFEDLGYEPIEHNYSSDGRNVLAVLEGTEYPDEYYMICAHYDAVDYYCADDNASGSAAVLEAARLFASKQFEYSIIFALWDEEEIGLIGSDHWATEAASNGDVIHGVINLDMISWDGDEDMVAEIHSSYTASSNDLSDYIEEINTLYELELTVEVEIPGTSASDHSKFWTNGYPAVLMIEEYYGGDFNPHYHTELDRISILSMPYFHEMAKLSIGSLVSMATPVVISSTHDIVSSVGDKVDAFPNPFQGNTKIQVNIQAAGTTQIAVYNSLGAQVSLLENGFVTDGEHTYVFEAGGLDQGMYFVQVRTQSGITSSKLMLQ